MAVVTTILDADSTCATCTSEDKIEFDTGFVEVEPIILIDEDSPRVQETPHLFLRQNYLASMQLDEPIDFILLDAIAKGSDDTIQLAQIWEIKSRYKRNMVSNYSGSLLLNLIRDYDDSYVSPNTLPLGILGFGLMRNRFAQYFLPMIRPYRSRTLYDYGSKVESSIEVDHYLAKRPMLDHLIRVAIKAIEENLYFEMDKYTLKLDLSQDPDCKTPDIRFSIVSQILNFDDSMELWERLSEIVEETIRKIAALNKMSEEEIEEVLDTFTISVQQLVTE